MLVELSKTQIKMLRSMGRTSEKRTCNKKIYINSNAIAIDIGMSWQTVQDNLIKFANLKGA